MPRFQFYEFNQSGVIDRVLDVPFTGYEQARTFAVDLHSCWPVEIWRGRQRIASVAPGRSALNGRASHPA